MHMLIKLYLVYQILKIFGVYVIQLWNNQKEKNTAIIYVVR